MSVYQNERCFLEDCPTADAKVTALDAIIEALLITAAEAGQTVDSSGYSLDDGQTKIRKEYRDPEEIYKAIRGFEQLRNYYISKCTGSVVQLQNKDRIKPW